MTAIPSLRVESGDLSGRESAVRGVFEFKGIPYAAPPIGALRWRAPLPPRRWSGVRQAIASGARSIQPEHAIKSISYLGVEKESEDCLFLNVWTPEPSRGAGLPVMVWIHGGGFATGSGALAIYDGSHLARLGVVVVTVNYRLGALGFLVHPDLSEDPATGARGNWGLLDQIAALRWVRDNVEAFGGDPSCVTIFGQSVGSSSVNCLMVSPLARGLFHRAIGQSGASLGPPGQPGGGSLMYLEPAQTMAQRICKKIGIRTIADLRAAPARDIQLGWPQDRLTRCWPVIDGCVIPKDVRELYEAGDQVDVPLLTGATGDEGSVRAPARDAAKWNADLRRAYGVDGDRLFEAYGGGSDLDAMSRRFGGHVTFNWQNWAWARLHAKTGGAGVFKYHFSRVPPQPANAVYEENTASRLGAFHTAEIPYVFGTLWARAWPWQDYDAVLSSTLSKYWVNFAKTGDPNSPGLPAWPDYDPDGGDTILHFGDAIAPGGLCDRVRLEVLDQCLARKRAREAHAGLAS